MTSEKLAELHRRANQNHVYNTPEKGVDPVHRIKSHLLHFSVSGKYEAGMIGGSIGLRQRVGQRPEDTKTKQYLYPSPRPKRLGQVVDAEKRCPLGNP